MILTRLTTAIAAASTLALLPASPSLGQGTDRCVPASRFPEPGLVSTFPASGIGGTDAYADGIFVHQDYVYDDHGAGRDFPVSGVPMRGGPGFVADSTARPVGSYVYPLDEATYVNNAADLRELRLRFVGGDLRVEAHLQTLVEARTTGVTVVFDVDARGGTVPLPHAAGVSVGGADLGVTIADGQVWITDLHDGSTTTGTADTDLDTNVLAASLPAASFDGLDVTRVWVVAGLWDVGAGNYQQVLPVPTRDAPGGRQQPADVRIFDVGFHPGEAGMDQWFDGRQASALAAADVSHLFGSVDLAAMRGGESRPWRPEPGFYEGIHRSSFTLEPYGEGWTLDTGYQGSYQPYGLYIPVGVDLEGPLPLTTFFHGATRNHTNLIGGTNMQSQLGDGFGTLLVAPLGRRSTQSEYDGDRWADIREVLDDVHRRFNVDPDRRFLTGYSQGGNAVYRSMTFSADEFAGAIIWAGQNPGAVPWLESSRWVPTLLLHSPADELVPYTESLRTHLRLDELGYEHELRTHGGAHEYQAVTDDYRQPAEWFAAHVRPVPPRVTYARVPKEDDPQFGLRWDRAYWLSGIEASGDRGVVDVVSFALSGHVDTLDVFVPEEGPPGPYLRDGLAYVPRDPQPATDNRLEIRTTGISSLTVDLVTAGVDPRSPITLELDVDAPVTVTLHGLGTSRVVAGEATLAPGRCGAVVTAGSGTVTLAPTRPAGASTRSPDPRPLPATGGGLTAASLLCLACAMSTRRAARADDA